jgi:hypothetical protein
MRNLYDLLRSVVAYPKLGAVATTRMNGRDFASLLERAIERSGKGPELRLIEGSKSDDQVSNE